MAPLTMIFIRKTLLRCLMWQWNTLLLSAVKQHSQSILTFSHLLKHWSKIFASNFSALWHINFVMYAIQYMRRTRNSLTFFPDSALYHSYTTVSWRYFRKWYTSLDSYKKIESLHNQFFSPSYVVSLSSFTLVTQEKSLKTSYILKSQVHN